MIERDGQKDGRINGRTEKHGSSHIFYYMDLGVNKYPQLLERYCRLVVVTFKHL